jgi:hypothetical protein
MLVGTIEQKKPAAVPAGKLKVDVALIALGRRRGFSVGRGDRCSARRSIILCWASGLSWGKSTPPHPFLLPFDSREQEKQTDYECETIPDRFAFRKATSARPSITVPSSSIEEGSGAGMFTSDVP